LVNQRFVEFATEDDVGSSNGGRLSLFVQELEFHELRSFRQVLDCRTHDDITILVARNCALDQQQAALSINANDVEVLNSAGYITHVTRHALTWEHAAWILSHTNGT